MSGLAFQEGRTHSHSAELSVEGLIFLHPEAQMTHLFSCFCSQQSGNNQGWGLLPPEPLGCMGNPGFIFGPSGQSLWMRVEKEGLGLWLVRRKVNTEVRAEEWRGHVLCEASACYGSGTQRKLDSQRGRVFPVPSQPLNVLTGPLLTRLLLPRVSRQPLLSLSWRALNRAVRVGHSQGRGEGLR